MKNSIKCPKCLSAEIIRVPPEVGGHSAANKVWMGWTIFSAVKVTRYVCGSCGFNEEWIDSAGDIAKIREKFGG
jgi:predicted RNA-binding Zn-ribbon protein involved in translation (DUF1610 family)